MADADFNIRINALATEARQAIARVKQELSGVATAGKEATSNTDFSKTEQGIGRVNDSLNYMRAQLVGAAAGLATLATAKVLLRLAELAKTLDARLRIATRSSYEFAQAQAEVHQISQRTGTALEANIGLFAKLRVNAGMAQKDALKLTEIIAKATQLDGGGASAQAAIFQLQQALASGVLRGDELNSVLEQTPSLAKAIADGLGLSIGQMRQLAAEGRLTADKVKEALFEMSDAISADYAKLPVTTSRAMESIRNNVIKAVSEIDRAAGITDKLARALQFVADHVNALVKILGVAFIVVLQRAILMGAVWTAGLVAQLIAMQRATVGTYTYVTGLATASAAATTATVAVGRLTLATKLLRAALALVGGPIGLVITALLALGMYLYNRFANAKTSIDQTRDAAEALQGSLSKITDEVGKATASIRNQYDAAIGKVREAAQVVTDSYKSQVEAQQDALARQLDGIEEQAAAEKATLVDTEQAKLDAITQSSEQTMATWRRTYDALTEAARGAGADVTAVEQQATAEKLRLLEGFEKQYRRTIDALVGEEQRLLEEVRRRGEERVNMERSAEEIIRNLRRSTMDDYAAYQDKNAEIDEKQAEIRRLIAQGDMESLAKASKLAEDVMRAAQSNSSEVTRQVERDGETVTEVVVSKQQAVARSVAEVQESARLAAEAMRKMDEQQLAAAASAHDGAQQAQEQLAGLSAEAAKTQAAFDQGIEVRFDADLGALEAALADAQRLARANAVSVRIDADLEILNAKLMELEKHPERLPTLKPEIELSAEQLRDQMTDLGQAIKQDKIDLPVGFNLDDTRTALADFQQQVQSELKIETSSKHEVTSNVKEVGQEIQSLNGKNTSSIHTIVTRTVEEHARGGVVGVQGYAGGGVVGFPYMTGGVVPGSGDGDTVPRTLPAGSFVLRKAAVGKYGLNRILHAVKHFREGGVVEDNQSVSGALRVANMIAREESNKRIDKKSALKKMDMGQEAILARAEKLGGLALRKRIEREWEIGFKKLRGTSNWGGIADLLNKTVQELDDLQIKQERRAEIERRRGERQSRPVSEVMALPFASGGSTTDTVPAMLTPGEIVVNRATVQRLGLGFFHALNNLRAPARILGYASGGIVPGAPLPPVGDGAGISKTVNVTLKLPGGQNRTVQTVGGTDQNLLDALKIAGLAAV